MPNAEMEYKTAEDLRREAWYELQSAMKVGTILTGKLVSVEQTAYGAICTTNCKGFRIVIPASEMNVNPITPSTQNVPKKETIDTDSKPYYQMFSEKFGFTDGLSIVDLLFNLGPESVLYLKEKSKNI